jgi:hypothetical protein
MTSFGHAGDGTGVGLAVVLTVGAAARLRVGDGGDGDDDDDREGSPVAHAVSAMPSATTRSVALREDIGDLRIGA